MSYTSEQFLMIFDFALTQVINVFVVSDSIVIVDSPRFSILSFFISILFLSFVISLFNWLRGYPVGSTAIFPPKYDIDTPPPLDNAFLDDMADRSWKPWTRFEILTRRRWR